MNRLAVGILVVGWASLAVPAFAQPIERINPDGLSKPTTYSHVVKVGKLLFIAGQVGSDAGGKLAGPTMKEQFEQVLKNLQTALASQGAGYQHLAKITIFVTSVEEFRAKEVVDLRAKYFGDNRPASTLVQVAQLATPALKVEVEAIAALP
jgi:enamine deaminase RidA (YjgF/YER057c/UK114 family)